MFRKKPYSLMPNLLQMLFASAMPSFAFDPNDPADMAEVQKRIDEAVEGLASKNKELLADVKKLKAKRDPGDSNAADMERLEAENERLSSELATASKNLKAAQKAAEDSGKALTSERSYTERLLVDNGLSAELAANGVTNASHAKAAAALLRSTSKIEITVDGDTRTATVGGKPLKDFVKEWAGTDDGKNFVTATTNGGGGAPGSQQQQHKQAGNMGGTREERIAAINAKLGDKLAATQ
jgi:Skp family chaperone for outer membrane proteins